MLILLRIMFNLFLPKNNSMFLLFEYLFAVLKYDPILFNTFAKNIIQI
jgi:hypothetical protein